MASIAGQPIRIRRYYGATIHFRHVRYAILPLPRLL